MYYLYRSSIWHSFIFSRQLLQSVLLLENYPELIHTTSWDMNLPSGWERISCSVIQKTMWNWPFPFSGSDLTSSAVLKLATPYKVLILMCFSTQAQAKPLFLCPSGAIVLYLRSRKLQLQKERRGYAFASTQAGSVQQRTCSSLSLSSQLPVWLIVLSGSTPWINPFQTDEGLQWCSVSKEQFLLVWSVTK